MEKNCQACGKFGSIDRAHIKSKGSGGTWDDQNILHLCRGCHIKSHSFGWYKFSQKYPAVLWELKKRGWAFENLFGVWKLTRKQ